MLTLKSIKIVITDGKARQSHEIQCSLPETKMPNAFSCFSRIYPNLMRLHVYVDIDAV